MAENIERATPSQLQALVLELVERVETSGALSWRLQGAVRAREQRSGDPLAWYAKTA